MSASCENISRLLRDEFRLRNFCFRYKDFRVLAYSPWLPEGRAQLLFIAYRWIISVYFLAWLVPSVTLYTDRGEGMKFLIYLTDWSYLMFNAYLLVAALASTVQFAKHVTICKSARASRTRRPWDSESEEIGLVESGSKSEQTTTAPYVSYGGYDSNAAVLSSGYDSGDGVKWYQKLQWLLLNVGVDMTLLVPIIYWSVVYTSSVQLTPDTFQVHLVNGIIAFFDLWFSGVVIRLLHVIYPIIFTSAFLIFSGIYYAAGGRNIEGKSYIYSALDYEHDLGRSIGLAVAVVLFCIPLIHAIVFFIYMLRGWLVSHLCRGKDITHETL